MALPNRDFDHQILQVIASGEHVTQRSLAGKLGVALGLTNLLVRRLASKGYIRISGMGTRHIRYLMTPTGWEALARATRYSLENTLRLYTDTREQIRASLTAISRQCPDTAGGKAVVFYGAGDVAEIAFVSLQNTDLRLIGVVDDRRRGLFFGMPIRGRECLTSWAFDGAPYSRVIVTSLRHADAIQLRLHEGGIPQERVCCL